MRNIGTMSGWVLAIVLSFQVSQAGASVIVDNLSNPIAGNGIVGASQFEGQQFNTGSSSYYLDSIVANLGGLDGSITTVATLVTDNGDTPQGGTVLTTFTVPTIGVTYANLTFLPTTSGVLLSANTNYWFILSYTAGTGAFGWGYAGVQTATGPGSLGHYATNFNDGNGWIIDNYGPGSPDFIQVNGTPTPEPATISTAVFAGLFGLGNYLRNRSRASQRTALARKRYFEA